MKKAFFILFAFISVLALSQVPQRFNKVVVTGDIASPKFIKTGSNADSVLLGNGSARSVNSLKTDTVSLSNRINAKAAGNGTANGTNTGDETLTSIKTKLGAATAVSDGYLKYQDWNTFNSKEPAFTKNTAFNKNFGTTTGTVLEGRTFGTAANSAVGDFIQNQNSTVQSANMWINGAKFESDVQNGSTNTAYGAFKVSRTFTTLDRHSFDDYSVLQPISGGYGFGVFDASTDMQGTVNNDHLISYQARTKYNSTGTLFGNYGMTGLLCNASISNGTVTNNHGILINDITKTGGTVINNYGIRIKNIANGTTNYAIYSDGGDSYFAGSASFGKNLTATSTDITTVSAIGNGTSKYGQFVAKANTTASVSLATFGPNLAFPQFGVGLANWSILSSSGAESNGMAIGTLTEKPLIFGTNNINRLRFDGTTGAATFSSTVNSTGFLLNGNNLTSSLSTNYIPKWNGSTFVNATAGTDYQLPITLTTNGTSGAATLSGNVLNVPNYAASGVVNQTQTTVNGSTGGNMVCSMPFQTSSYKKAIIKINSLAGTATYTFPSAFTLTTPGLFESSIYSGNRAYTPTSTSITVTCSSGSFTGFITIEGY